MSYTRFAVKSYLPLKQKIYSVKRQHRTLALLLKHQNPKTPKQLYAKYTTKLIITAVLIKFHRAELEGPDGRD